MRYLGTCDGNMEEGSMRADVNVSVRKHGEPYRTRCEVKNVNSVRFVMQAIEAEAKRQIEVWESGDMVQQETRLFDSARGVTRSMRSKEDAHDYRYFPDPGSAAPCAGRGLDRRAEGVAAGTARRQARAVHARVRPDRLRRRACWSPSRRPRISTRPSRAAAMPKIAANWVMGDLFAALNRTGKTIETSPVSAAIARRACST